MASSEHKKIEDYALIGDSRSAALVGLDGAIDWLCLPQFDSPACFAALLGGEDNGHWRIASADQEAQVSRRYRTDTLVLETEFRTSTARVRVIDFMAMKSSTPNLVRIVEGLEGKMTMDMDLSIRFDYGRLAPWVSRAEHGRLKAVAGPHLLTLHTTADCRGEGFFTVSRFDVAQGE